MPVVRVSTCNTCHEFIKIISREKKMFSIKSQQREHENGHREGEGFDDGRRHLVRLPTTTRCFVVYVFICVCRF